MNHHEPNRKVSIVFFVNIMFKIKHEESCSQAIHFCKHDEAMFGQKMKQYARKHKTAHLKFTSQIYFIKKKTFQWRAKFQDASMTACVGRKISSHPPFWHDIMTYTVYVLKLPQVVRLAMPKMQPLRGGEHVVKGGFLSCRCWWFLLAISWFRFKWNDSH